MRIEKIGFSLGIVISNFIHVDRKPSESRHSTISNELFRYIPSMTCFIAQPVKWSIGQFSQTVVEGSGKELEKLLGSLEIFLSVLVYPFCEPVSHHPVHEFPEGVIAHLDLVPDGIECLWT